MNDLSIPETHIAPTQVSKIRDIPTPFRYRTNKSQVAGRPVVISMGIGHRYGAYYRKENGCLMRLKFISESGEPGFIFAHLNFYLQNNKRQKKLIKVNK